MDKMWLVLKEQLDYLSIVFRIAKYENKASYQGHHLGMVWEILNPLLQVSVFFLVFGIGFRGGVDVNGVPFIVWLIMGQASWMLMNSAVQGGSISVKQKLGLVSKMKFPISILPTIIIVTRLKPFYVMMVISIMGALITGVAPTLHWFGAFYYFIAMTFLLIFMGFLTSTINILFNDFQFILTTIMRLIFFTSGVMFPLEDMQGRLGDLLALNPFHYIVSGFRNSFLYQITFWDRGRQTLFFWAFTLFIGLVGSHLHLKFRARFSDFV